MTSNGPKPLAGPFEVIEGGKRLAVTAITAGVFPAAQSPAIAPASGPGSWGGGMSGSWAVDDLEPIVEAAYGALYEPRLWNTVLAGSAQALSADAAALHGPGLGQRGDEIYLAHNLDLTPVQAALEAGASSPVMTRAAAIGVAPGVFLHQDAMPPEALRASDYYRQVMQPLGVEHGLSSLFSGLTESRPTALSLMRGRGARPFGEREAEMARQIYPHLRRAIRLRLRVGLRQAVDPALHGALDGFDVACCLLGEQGRLLYANLAARNLLAGPGAVLLAAEGRLTAPRHEQDGPFQAAVAAACDRAGPWSVRAQGEVRLNPEGGDPVVAVIVPLGEANPFVDAGPVRAALYLMSTGRRRGGQALERLRRLYQLTQAEADIVAQLLAGDSVADIAVARGSSVNTVRTQVRVILEKTASDRQADLFRLSGLLGIQR